MNFHGAGGEATGARGWAPAAESPEPLQEEEIILECLEEIGTTFPSRTQAISAIHPGLVEIRTMWDKASASREADGMLRLLYLLGACPSREMSLKAKVLQAVIAKTEESLSGIAIEYNVSRAAVSKIGRELKEFLGLKISTSTRNEEFVEQCRTRATRIHSERKARFAVYKRKAA